MLSRQDSTLHMLAPAHAHTSLPLWSNETPLSSSWSPSYPDNSRGGVEASSRFSAWTVLQRKKFYE